MDISVHPACFHHKRLKVEEIDRQLRQDTGLSIVISKGVATLGVWPPKVKPKNARKG